jgi:hypothetical protein
MNRLGILTMTTMVLLVPLAAGDAVAQQKSLKEQLVGTWTLVSLVEQYQDGRKDSNSFGPNLKGMLMLDRTGQFSLQLIGGERAKTSGNPRSPIGPAVAYFGTYSVGEGDKSLTYHVERSTFPDFEGTDQKATVTIAGDELRYVRAPIPSPAGTFVPTLEWRRVK